MNTPFHLIFDDVMLKQLQKAGRDMHLRSILTKLFDDLEVRGPAAGKLLDSHLFIYEIKNMHPPLRLYFKHNLQTNEIYVFEYEMKTSELKQKKTISRIRFKARSL